MAHFTWAIQGSMRRRFKYAPLILPRQRGWCWRAATTEGLHYIRNAAPTCAITYPQSRGLHHLKTLTITAALALLAAAPAQAAGIHAFKVPADAKGPAIDAMLWSPCPQPGKAIPVDGPITITGVRDCPLPDGRLPLIVFSHGLGGNSIGHHDTAEALADNGFLVVSFNHVLDSSADMSRSFGLAAMAQRPADVSRVIDHVLKTQGAHIDAARIGFFGFSRGGYTGLVLAGAVATPPWWARAFTRAANWWKGEQVPTILSGADARIKAFVIADPVNLFPDKASLQRITAPIQLWASQKGGQGVTPEEVSTIAGNLPRRPEFRIEPNSTHLSFIFPCSPQVMKVIRSDVCTDPPGFDRPAFHRALNERMLRFFRATLRSRDQP